jgi:hypothetical protein
MQCRVPHVPDSQIHHVLHSGFIFYLFIHRHCTSLTLFLFFPCVAFTAPNAVAAYMRSSLLPGAMAALILLATFVSLTFTQDLPDGLKIETTKSVACQRKSKAGDKLSVHYRGVLLTGVEFDSSYGRGQPFQFTLGVGQVIKGWDRGMAGMCPGEARRLTIPPKLGYGSQNMGAIPPNSVLSTLQLRRSRNLLI